MPPTSSPRRPRPRPPLRQPRPLRPRGLLGVVVPRGREGASGRKAGPAAGEPGNYNCGDRSASPGLRTPRRPMTGDHAGLQNKRLCGRCGWEGASSFAAGRPLRPFPWQLLLETERRGPTLCLRPLTPHGREAPGSTQMRNEGSSTLSVGRFLCLTHFSVASHLPRVPG